MTGKWWWCGILLASAIVCSHARPATAQSGGTVSGVVTIGDDARPLHDARVTILKLKRSVVSNDDGTFIFDDVPPGDYTIIAHVERLPDASASIGVRAGKSTTVELRLLLATVTEQVTVTANGDEQLASTAVETVSVIGSDELARNNPSSIGDALQNESGVAKRSAGPGNGRPIIRGFDGDRVLVLQDGMRTGSLGAQSGDHAEPIDVLSLEKIEVVKGPSTLLYGSSAIGGVVNAVQSDDVSQQGVRGYATVVGATNSYQAGVNAGVTFGLDIWTARFNGGTQRSGDYESPLGRVPNSYTRDGSLTAGLGRYGERVYASFNYTYDNREYGIPFDSSQPDPEVVFLTPRRNSFQFNLGLTALPSYLESARFSFQYNNYKHNEVDALTNAVNTAFQNNVFTYRAMFEQKPFKSLAGTFGIWGLHRDYTATGDEAITPPTIQNAYSAFGVETLSLRRFVLQFGGRIEHNSYKPDVTEARGALPNRSFTGASAAIGARVPLWQGASFVANYTTSYRAPSLEELYNNGPHPGNNAFEIGNPDLARELANGIEIGIRQSSDHVRFEANLYHYRISDFVYLAPTGAFEDGLQVAAYDQADSRFRGAEVKFDAEIRRDVWLRSGLDYVNADIVSLASPIPLPRIPPLRGHLELDYTVNGFRVRPEVVMVKNQNEVFPAETPTPGYTVLNLGASYTIAREHSVHVISFEAFNLADRLYFNNSSFIKDFAPEIGRGYRLAYTIRFF